jgi:ApbE superfamily uncharacterized protein (UPF0280 family)
VKTFKPTVKTLKEKGAPKAEKKDAGLPKSEADMGEKHESEHQDTIKEIQTDAKAGTEKAPEVYQRKMALKHLRKDPNYYTKLNKLEGEDSESEIEDRPVG